MFLLISLISSLWFIRQLKVILFWLYLWQLKEYHLGRFLAHFQTEKGKKLFLNWLIILKIVLFFYALFLAIPQKLLPWQVYFSWVAILMALYFFESLKFFWDFIQKKFKAPILTKKTLTLISTSLIFETLFLFVLFQTTKLFYWFSFSLLSFDIFTPFLASGIVFLFQPLTIYWRNQIIKKAKEKRKKFKNLIVIGITGSYGKTSTKEFLAEILSEKFNVLRTKEHQNSEIGISQCILNDLKPEHEIFVVEMGAYNRGGIKLLCEIAKPKIGILTGINEQHMATFGSQENIIKTKYELIESLPRSESGSSLLRGLPENGLAIVNGNNKYCLDLYQKTNISKKLTYTTFPTIVENVVSADLWAKEIKIEKEHLVFKVFVKNGDFVDFKVKLLGTQNAENILLAVCCAKELGMSLTEISKACEKIKPLSLQMELKKGQNGLNIIDATYSTNLDGVISHLEYLKIWPGQKIIVMPCLIELGKASIEVHKRIGQKIAEVCDLAIITTKDRFREIKEEAGEKAIFLDNPKKIFEKIKNFYQEDDVLLLEGRLANELIKLLGL